MYHPRFQGNHYEMGEKFGSIVKKLGVKFPMNLDRFQKEHGKKSGVLLKQYFPEVSDEIKGVTDISGIDNELFTAWMMCMGCCMYNLDTDQNAEIRGCTAFSFEQNGDIYYGRDNDLPPFLKEVSKSILYKPDNENHFLLNTSSFINGEEGINNHGLVIAMTFVLSRLEEIKPGFNSVFIVRYLLEKCKTVDEALKSLKELPIASNCNIIMVDVSGKMIIAECTPERIEIRKPKDNGNGRKFIITVNHFTSEKMKQYSPIDCEYLSDIRYKTAYNTLSKENEKDGVKLSKDLLSGKYGFMCQYKKELNFDTVWSSVFNLKSGEVFRAEGNPCKTKYIKDDRYIKNIKNKT
jgi:predicted choloylglycine hydrolase